MSYKKFEENRLKIHKKLLEFHEDYSKEIKFDAVGHDKFRPSLIRWFNSICKTQCGITTKTKFRSKTLWSKMHGPKEGALFVMGFRADRFDNNEDTVCYRLFLEQRNTQADTDMGVNPVFYIDFTVYKQRNVVSEYSFNFC